MITYRMEILQEEHDQICPDCGGDAFEWDKSPWGYAYCYCGASWRVKLVRVQWVPFSDTQKRVHLAHVGYAIERKDGDVVKYITELS